MDVGIKSPKIRYYLGSMAIVLGLTTALILFWTGITGIILLYGYGDQLRLGNPTAGPGVCVTLMLEGFLLDLMPALATAFLGFCIRFTLYPTIKMLKTAKGGSSTSKKPLETKEQKEKPTTWSKFINSEVEEDAVDWEGKSRQRESYIEEEDYKRFSKYKSKMKKFAAEAPQYLWISLLITSCMNFIMVLTCFVLAGGEGAAGIAEAMRNYGTDADARRAVDWAQTTGECCADETYTEWFAMQWCTEMTNMPPSEHMSESVNVCGPNHKSVKYDVPGTCCNPPRAPCLHHALDLLGLGPLNMDGCGPYVKSLITPKYKGLGWFHVFLGLLKLILVAVVLLLSPVGGPQSEKAKDEETEHLLTDDEFPPQKRQPSTSPLSQKVENQSTPEINGVLRLKDSPIDAKDYSLDETASDAAGIEEEGKRNRRISSLDRTETYHRESRASREMRKRESLRNSRRLSSPIMTNAYQETNNTPNWDGVGDLPPPPIDISYQESQIGQNRESGDFNAGQMEASPKETSGLQQEENKRKSSIFEDYHQDMRRSYDRESVREGSKETSPARIEASHQETLNMPTRLSIQVDSGT